MHVSRVAAALLRIVRRSRRPLAIALVSLLATGVAVTGVSSAAIAAEQSGQRATSGGSTSSADSSSTVSTEGSGDSTASDSASGQSSSSSSSSGSTGAGRSTGTTKPAAPAPKPVSKPASSTKQAVTVTVHAPATTPAAPLRSSLVALAAPVITLSGTTAVADSNHDGRTSPGDVATTTWTVTNTGPDQVTGLSLTLDRGTATCPTTTIAATSSVTCTSTTAVKQSDIDAAKLAVTGTAHGTVLGNPSASDPATVTKTLTVSAKLSLSQSIVLVSDADHDGATSKGDRLQFVFTVKNTGTQTLHGLTIVDSKLANAHISIHCSATTLAPGHSTTCRSGSYTVSGFDAKQGVVTNSARAKATTPQGGSVLSAKSTKSKGVKHEITLRPNLSMTMSVLSVKDNDNDGQPTAGDSIRYAFSISNVGNTSVSGIYIVDRKLDRLHVGIHCSGSFLSAGSSMRCTSDSLKITGFNVKQGKLANFATAHGVGAGRSVQAFDALDLSLNVPLSELVGSTSAASLPRTGGVPTQPMTLAFWMILLGFGLVVAGRQPGRMSAPLRGDRSTSFVDEDPEE